MRKFLARLGDWLDPSRDAGHERHKTAEEIALENAAEALGADLGDYYVDEREIPEEELTLATEQITPGVRDRVSASREETLVYIDRRRRRVRRVRRLRLAALALSVMFALAGIAICARLLTDHGDNEPDPGRADAASRRPHAKPNPYLLGVERPAPFGTRVSVSVPQGSETASTSSFLSTKGHICSALVSIRNGISTQNSSGGCIWPENMRRRLATEGAFFSSIINDKLYTAMEGYARTDVDAIVGPGSGWGAPSVVALSRPWVPTAPGLENEPHIKPFKAFLAIVHPALGRHRRAPKADCAMNALSYRLMARHRDGTVSRVKWAPLKPWTGCEGVPGAPQPSKRTR